MTSEQIEAEVKAQAGVIVTPHEGAEIAHYLMACRVCCIQHFIGLERKRCRQIANDFDHDSDTASIAARIRAQIEEGK